MENILEEYLYRRKAFTKALYERPQSLSTFFVYDEYLEGPGVYVNKDGTFGAIFDVQLVEHEPLGCEEILEAISGVAPWFKVPENCVLQVIHEQSAVSARDKVWEEMQRHFPTPAKLSKEILSERIEHFKRLSQTDSDMRPLRRKTYLCIRYFPTTKTRKKIRLLDSRGEKFLFEQVTEATEELRDFVEVIETLKTASGVKLRTLAPDALLESLRRFLNPKEFYSRDFMPFNPNESISNQAVFNSPKLSHSSFEREGVKSRTIVLKMCPKRSTPGAVAGFLALPFPFRISMNFSFPSVRKVNRILDLKSFFLERTPNQGAARQKADLETVQKKIAHGSRCAHMTFSIIVEGETDDEINRRTRELIHVFQNDLGCEVIVDDDIGFALCLNSLPLMYSPESDFSSQRFIKIMDSDVLNFMPIFDSFTGVNEPLQLFLSREGNLVPFSFTDSERPSQHSVVLGDTGGGKSEFILDAVQAYKRRYPDPLIFYVEKRASSKGLCKSFGGEVTVFHPNEEIPFTPFRGHFDDEKVNVLSLIILTAIKLTNPKFDSESEHSSIITQALKDAYRRKCEQVGLTYENRTIQESDAKDESVITMDDVVAAIGDLHDNESFKSLAGKIDEVVQKLREFSGDGKYAQYFRGTSRSTKDGDCSFYVYDLDPLDSDPVLKAIMTLSVFEEIKRLIALPENRGRGGLIVFEEMGQLGANNPTAAQYVVDFAETIRKLKFWLIGIAPSPKNFFTTDAGRALWAAADNFFFFNMKPDNVEYVRKNSEILSGPPGDIVKSLSTVPGKYAEVFYTDKVGKKRGAFRFVQTRALSNYSEQPAQSHTPKGNV